MQGRTRQDPTEAEDNASVVGGKKNQSIIDDFMRYVDKISGQLAARTFTFQIKQKRKMATFVSSHLCWPTTHEFHMTIRI